jgi:galactose mutarotase-like enzyme
MSQRSAPSGQQWPIRHGDHQAVVVEVGGGLRSYTVAGEDVLDGYPVGEMVASGRGQILAPWPNRIADGRYDFGGHANQLALSEPATRTAIHGLVRFANWVVAEQGVDHAVMAHRLHPQPGYPFLVDLRATYELGADGLAVTFALTNRGDTPAPIGVGAHPYVRLGPGAIDGLELRVPARSSYVADDRGIPTAGRSVDGTPHDFRVARPIGDTRLDTGFADLTPDDDGRTVVELSEPPSGRRVQVWLSEGFGYLMLFTGDTVGDPARRRQGLAVEPMSCAPNAFQSGDGLVVLDPGDTYEAAWGISAMGF